LNLAFTFDHHNAISEWADREKEEWLLDVFEAPKLKIRKRCTTEVRSYVSLELQKDGWALNPALDQDSKLKVTAIREDLAFQIQMGNVSRVAYDLLKLQYLYQSKKISAAAIAVPTQIAADKISSNVTYAERLCSELELFDRVITVPIFVVAFQ